MRLFVNYTLVYLAIILGYYLSWRTWQPNLNGHWHIVDEELPNGKCSTDYIPTIDFINHKDFVVTDYSSDGYRLGGKVNRLARQGKIFAGCFHMDFTYTFEETALIIKLSDPVGGKVPLIIRGEGPWFKCPHKGLLLKP